MIGTTGILKAIKAHAPTVKRVVITSSFAAIMSASGKPPGYVFSEKDWNPVTTEEAVDNPSLGYRASKTFAEKAAWEFVEKEKPNFTLATMNPPLVFGPVNHHLGSLKNLNTSNQLVRDMMIGNLKDGLSAARVPFWVSFTSLSCPPSVLWSASVTEHPRSMSATSLSRTSVLRSYRKLGASASS